MKLLLINPSKYDKKGKLMKFKYGTFPPVNLLILASLIKDYKQVEIKVVDEFIEDIPFNDNFDLVGITTLFTSTFPRVIDISKKFRKNGIPVVLGGSHATCTYQDSIKYADSIVVGEGEDIFQQLIDNFLTKKKLKKIYKNENPVRLEKMPTIIPRYDLINLNKYFKVGIIKKTNHFQIETSRGCPFQCKFCTVRITHGGFTRYKKISSVIEEIRFLKKNYNASFFSFGDDNFLVNTERFKTILKEISKENIKFWCEVSTRVIDKPELIPLLKKAGCISALVGFETINKENLKSVGKYHNKIQDYETLFNLFKEYDIPICPGYIFGFDNDDKNTFQEAFDFLKKFKVQRVALTILTPYPGTELYEQLKKEKRIINNDLSLYDCSSTVFQPKKMSINQLTEEYWKLNRRFYSIKEIFSRLIKAKKSEFLYSLITNFRFRSLVYQNINQYNSGIKRIN